MANSRTLELILKVVVAASQDLQRLKDDLRSLGETQFGKVGDQVGDIGKQAAAAAAPAASLNKGLLDIGGMTGAIAGVGLAFGAVSSAIGVAIGAVRGFYQATVGEAEKLNAQLLSSQTNLASSTRLFRAGVEITDPTEKINASRESLEAALQTIQKETQSLVGVTSGEVNELFQITLQNAASLNNQAKGLDESLANPIKAATSLTKGWAASLKVIGLPLNQAGQEIRSILTGQIDQNSMLAKNLKITNEQVNSWKAQGTLVTELDKRLKTFVAGNAIAANSIDGVFSNIKDYFEIFTREVGKPLLQPIIDSLSRVFAVIDANRDQIISTIQTISGAIATVLGGVLGVVVQIAITQFQVLFGVIQTIVGVLSPIGSALSSAFGGLGELLAPVGKFFNDLINSPIGQFTVQVLAIGAAIAVLVPLVGAIAPFIAGIGGAITAGGAAIAGFVGSVGGLAAGIGGFFAGLSGVIPAIMAAFGGLAAAITGSLAVVGGALSAFAAGVVAFLSPIIVPIAAVGAAIAAAFLFLPSIIDGLKPAFEPLMKLAAVIFEIGKAIVMAIGQDFLNKIQMVGEAIAFYFDLIVQASKPVVAFLQDVFLGAFSMIGEAIAAFANSAVSTITSIVNNPAFGAIAKTLGVDIDQLKKSLKDLDNKTKDSAKIQKDAARAGSDELTIKGQELTELGNSYKQLADQAANAQRVIDEQGNGESKAFNDAAKRIIDLTNQQRELGQITQAEADKRLSAIANNAKIEVDIQQKAKDAIAKLREDETKDAIADSESAIKDIESAVKRREISAVEGEKRISQLKKEQFAIQLKDVEAAMAAEQAAIDAGTGSTEKLEDLSRKKADIERQQKDQATKAIEDVAKAEAESQKKRLDTQKSQLNQHLAETEAAIATGAITEVEGVKQITQIRKQQLDLQLQDILAQIKVAEAARDPQKVAQLTAQAGKIRADMVKQEAEGQKQIFNAQLKEVEDRERKATAIAKTAETERIAELNKLVASGIVKKEDIEAEKLKVGRKSIEAELQGERDKIAAISAISATTPAQEKDKQDKILAIRQKSADLAGKLVENEIAQQEALKQAAIRAIEKQSRAVQNKFTAQKQALEPQVMAFDAVSKAIANQNKLLEARQQLIQSVSGLMQTQYQIAADMARAAGDEEKAKQIEIEAAEAEIEQQKLGFEIEKQTLIIEQEKNMLLLEQEKIKLRIQKIDADAAIAAKEAELAKLKASGASPEEIKAAELGLEAAKQRRAALDEQGELLDEQIEKTKEINALQVENLEAKQSQQSLQSRAKLAKLTDGTEDDQAIADEALAGARASRQRVRQRQQEQVANNSEAIDIAKTGREDAAKTGEASGNNNAIANAVTAGTVAGLVAAFQIAPPLKTIIVPDPQNPTATPANAQQGGAMAQVLATLAPQIAFNNFFESQGSQQDLSKTIGKQLFDTFSQVIKQASQAT